MQRGDVFQVGDAVDPSKYFFQPFHNNGRDGLTSDEATRFIGENPGNADEQEPDRH